MNLFDHIDPKSLDRRAWQLWVLALTTILILATGLALMMYVTVFSKPTGGTGHTHSTLFIGYCVLMPLIMGYLFDRQIVIRHLRCTIDEDQKQISNLQHEVRANLLESLPGMGHFQDRLAMEYRRASSSEQPISLVMVGVKPSLGPNPPGHITNVFGDAAKALAGKLRGDDSIYHIGQGVFAMLLPRIRTAVAKVVVGRLEEGLTKAARPEIRFVFECQLVNYPDNVASAREMEQGVASFLSAYSKGSSKSQPQEAEAIVA